MKTKPRWDVARFGARVLAVALLGCALLSGCHRPSGTDGAAVFANAMPELKQAWDAAARADQANDYVTAVLGYKQLLRQPDQLKPEQFKAVEEASGKLYQRLVAAAQAGDAPARQAIATLGNLDRQSNMGR
ncbi:MAG TPA: hypothetical protein VFV96_06080 [Verrucomicrobiae bacterium]|nr:hypothetical protein [Verrucomicrobiae bacterium]